MDQGPSLPPERPDVPPRPDLEGEEPPRHRSATSKVIAAATALLVGAVAVAAYVGDPDGGGPRTRANGKLQEGRDYAFLAFDVNGDPVRWNPCGPIHYVANLDQAPEDALADVQEAARRVTEATGIELVYDGTTNEIPTMGRRAATAGMYGTGWDPVVIAWTRPDQTDIPLGERDAEGRAVARALALASTVDADDVYVSGVIVLDATLETASGFGSSGSWGLILMHELGHVLGLDHVTSINEVMNEGYSFNTGWGRGDRRALAEVGRERGCLDEPPPPDMCYMPPPAETLDAAIVGADAEGPEDVWAVGSNVLHWDGSGWSREHVSGDEVADVALAGSKALGVGRVASSLGGFPMTARLDGATLSSYVLRVDTQGHGELHAVSASGPGDAWAVGEWTPGKGRPAGPLILRFDGREWRQVRAPGVVGSLVDVFARAPGDVWAVGASGGGSFVLHWDGRAWTRVDVPVGDVELHAVAVTGPDDVWLAGARGFTGVVFHSKGSGWESLQPIDDADGFYGAAVGPGGVLWLAGRRSGPTGLANPLVARFDGGRWEELLGESVLPGVRAVANAVAPVSRNRAFAFGSAGDPEAPLILRSC